MMGSLVIDRPHYERMRLASHALVGGDRIAVGANSMELLADASQPFLGYDHSATVRLRYVLTGPNVRNAKPVDGLFDADTVWVVDRANAVVEVRPQLGFEAGARPDDDIFWRTVAETGMNPLSRYSSYDYQTPLRQGSPG